MCPRLPRESDVILRCVRAMAAVATWWHKADCNGAQRLPDGAALLVGNHGLYGFEVPVFFYLLHQQTRRFPIGLADRRVFGWRPMRGLLARCGGHIGTIDNALRLLAHQQLVVCYPGGSREVFKSPAQRYQLCWDRALGFARLAIRAGAPIVPFAGLGVDDSYRNLGYLPGMRALFGRYAVPLAIGLGPLPLPVRFCFRIGAPIAPPSEMSRAPQLKEQVSAAVRALLGKENDGQAVGEDAAAVL
jgi:1-acyl-sn-glycerol-3-phosphate acyltransferase